MHTDTSAMPRGYRLNRAMAWIRSEMHFPPLDREEVPGARAYFREAMDRRIRP